jgi:hypothetical protein
VTVAMAAGGFLLAAPVAIAKPGAEPDSVTLAVTRVWGPFSSQNADGTEGEVLAS